MFKILFAVAVCFVSTAHAGDRAYVYTFDYTNAASPGSDDALTGRVAKTLGKYSESCVDLRSQGMKSTGDLVTDGGVGIVTNAPLSQRALNAIKRSICAQKNELPKDFVADAANAAVLGMIPKCHAKVSMKSASLSQSKLAIHSDVDGQGEVKTDQVSTSELSGLPQFSEACTTGKYDDSFNNTASTQAAQIIVAGNFGAEKFNTISLQADNLSWTFGSASAETESRIGSLSFTQIKKDEYQSNHTHISK